MDSRRVGLIGFTLILAAAALLHSATAETFTVLDAAGWSIPNTGNDGVYRTWAAGKEFKVGDVLVFNFTTGMHDVTKVTEPNYNSCGKTDPIYAITTGPATVNLNATGMHYFICTVGGHCLAGQKLNVTVTANSNTRTPPPAAAATPPSPTPTPPSATPPPSTSTTPPPPPPPPTTTSPPPPPRPSSASSITFSGFSAAILSMVLVFLH